MSRLKMSRPNSSAPRRIRESGAWSGTATESVGENGARTSAKMATKMSANTIAKPMLPMAFLRMIRARVGACLGAGRERISGASTTLALVLLVIADPWVDHDVEEIDDKI